jgi:survival-of-motor-neuron-related-splicing factor 30
VATASAGVSAPKQRRVGDGAEVQDMPKWLEVKVTDDDKTRQKKRKLAKAYKSKARFARLDSQQKQKADAWKRFLAGKASKTKK